jgi:hypothetical protein
VRRAKLYYLRERVGKRARVRERRYAGPEEAIEPGLLHEPQGATDAEGLTAEEAAIVDGDAPQAETESATGAPGGPATTGEADAPQGEAAAAEAGSPQGEAPATEEVAEAAVAATPPADEDQAEPGADDPQGEPEAAEAEADGAAAQGEAENEPQDAAEGAHSGDDGPDDSGGETRSEAGGEPERAGADADPA